MWRARHGRSQGIELDRFDCLLRSARDFPQTGKRDVEGVRIDLPVDSSKAEVAQDKPFTSYFIRLKRDPKTERHHHDFRFHRRRLFSQHEVARPQARLSVDSHKRPARDEFTQTGDYSSDRQRDWIHHLGEQQLRRFQKPDRTPPHRSCGRVEGILSPATNRFPEHRYSGRLRSAAAKIVQVTE